MPPRIQQDAERATFYAGHVKMRGFRQLAIQLVQGARGVQTAATEAAVGERFAARAGEGERTRR